MQRLFGKAVSALRAIEWKNMMGVHPFKTIYQYINAFTSFTGIFKKVLR
jgi:hypothetical protein